MYLYINVLYIKKAIQNNSNNLYIKYFIINDRSK